MSRKPRHGGSNVQPFISDGSAEALPNGRDGYTLLAGKTYFYDLGGDVAPFTHFHVKWDAAAIIVVTFEDTDFEEITLIDATIGNWVKQDPTAGRIDATSGAIANSTLTIAGGAAGGATWSVAPAGNRRRRVKIVVGGTGGVVRVGTYGKD